MDPNVALIIIGLGIIFGIAICCVIGIFLIVWAIGAWKAAILVRATYLIAKQQGVRVSKASMLAGFWYFFKLSIERPDVLDTDIHHDDATFTPPKHIFSLGTLTFKDAYAPSDFKKMEKTS
jgi:hypothetical protein